MCFLLYENERFCVKCKKQRTMEEIENLDFYCLSCYEVLQNEAVDIEIDRMKEEI